MTMALFVPANICEKYEKFLGGILCLLPIVASLVPRSLSFMPALATLILYVFFRVSYGKWPALYRPAFLWMGILFTLMTVSTFWSVDPEMSLSRTLKTFPILMGAAFLFSLVRQSSGIYFRAWFPFAVIAAVLICAVQLYTHGFFYFLVNPRDRKDTYVNLFYLNRSDAAVLCMVPAALTALYVVPLGHATRMIVYGILAVALAGLLFLTNSQTAQLAALCGGFFYFIFPLKRRKAWLALMAALTILIFTSPWLGQWMFQTLPQYVQKSSYFQDAYALNRLEIWDFVARRALERPLAGHGIEATKAIKDFDSANLYNEGNTILHPHNFALQLWIELGLLGLVYATLFLNAILRTLMTMNINFSRQAVATFFIALAIASTGYGLWQAMWIGTYGLLFSLCWLSAPLKDKAGSAS